MNTYNEATCKNCDRALHRGMVKPYDAWLHEDGPGLCGVYGEPKQPDTVTITISRMEAARLRDGDPWVVPDSVRDTCRAALEGER